MSLTPRAGAEPSQEHHHHITRHGSIPRIDLGAVPKEDIDFTQPNPPPQDLPKHVANGGSAQSLPLLSQVVKPIRWIHSTHLRKTQQTEAQHTFKVWMKRLKLPRHATYAVLLMFLVGFFAAFVAILIEAPAYWMRVAQVKLAYKIENKVGSWFAYVGFTVICACLSTIISQALYPTVAGSGIPEIKVVLNGQHSHESFLSLRSFCAKVIGLVFSQGSGLMLGKEGPMVQFACTICSWLLYLPIFHKIASDELSRFQMMAAAAAGGVGANWGGPIGGVLFSIEVICSYYPTRNYLYAYVSALTGAILIRYLYNWRTGDFGDIVSHGLIKTSFPVMDVAIGPYELLHLVFIGVIMGLLSILYLRAFTAAFVAKDWFFANFSRYRPQVILTALVSILTAGTFYPRFVGRFMSDGSFPLLTAIFSLSPHMRTAGHDWNNRNIYLNLLAMLLIRGLALVTNPILPVPGGIFVSCMVIGGGLGRMWGELLYDHYGRQFPTHQGVLVPAAYAQAGASAFVSAVTHSPSASILMFEISGQIRYLLPSLVSTLVAYAISRSFTLSIFNIVSKRRNYLVLPEPVRVRYNVNARDIMELPAGHFLTLKSLESDAESLSTREPDWKFYPVVRSKEDMMLQGVVYRHDITHRIAGEEMYYYPTPLCFQETTTLKEMHLVLLSGRLDRTFVVRHGRLVGFISQSRLKTAFEICDSGAHSIMSFNARQTAGDEDNDSERVRHSVELHTPRFHRGL